MGERTRHKGRRIRYKGVPVADWLADLTGLLFVLMLLAALAGWGIDLLRGWLP
jgi:hypothetical protein